jgi:hypothetical protein
VVKDKFDVHPSVAAAAWLCERVEKWSLSALSAQLKPAGAFKM